MTNSIYTALSLPHFSTLIGTNAKHPKPDYFLHFRFPSQAVTVKQKPSSASEMRTIWTKDRGVNVKMEITA
jgi:hypothetical protein